MSIKRFYCRASSASKRNRSQDDNILPPGKRIPSSVPFKYNRGDNDSKVTPKAVSTEKRRPEHASFTSSNSNVKIEYKNRVSLKPIVKIVLHCKDIMKLNLKMSIVDANVPDLKIYVSNFSLVENYIQEEMNEKESASIAFQTKERIINRCETIVRLKNH